MTPSARPNLLAGEDLPPEPNQKRSIEKRARLKAAGLSLFREKGYEGASIVEIASRAGLAVGGFYLHYRSKRQLLLALMDELLDRLTRLDLGPQQWSEIRTGLRAFLARVFATDLQFLGAYRAWQEAALSDADLAGKQQQIQAWTTSRVAGFFTYLQRLPGARPGVDVPVLARTMDSFFWNLLAQAAQMHEVELNQWLDGATHLIYHALFLDAPRGEK